MKINCINSEQLKFTVTKNFITLSLQNLWNFIPQKFSLYSMAFDTRSNDYREQNNVFCLQGEYTVHDHNGYYNNSVTFPQCEWLNSQLLSTLMLPW